MKNSLLILYLLAFSSITNAQYTLKLADVDFNLSTGHISDYLNTAEKDIVIPTTFNGVVVTSIGSGAFFNRQLKKITIPNSVTFIDDYAFEDNQLEEITIGNSVISIGEGAFYDNQLKKIILPNSVTSIGEYAFESNQLDEITIPNSVISIGEGAFYDNALTKFNLPSNYQGNVYQWTDIEGNTYESGEAVTNLVTSYTLNEEVLAMISTTESKNIFNFYPNPSSDFIHSDLEVSNLTISNSQGIIVNQFDSNTTEYNVSNLETGIYFIEAIGTVGTTYTSKLIKE